MAELKGLRIKLTNESIQILEIIADRHGELDLSFSGAANIAVQIAGIVARTPIRLLPGELLYCCDILNGGAMMTEFKTPDSVVIQQALESMKWSLFDGVEEPGILEKWGIEAQPMITRLELMDDAQLFALAFATRQFWSGKPFGKIKALSDCEDYKQWAAQWVDGDI